jgi:Spy/CpxP family protein refolding chaperone
MLRKARFECWKDYCMTKTTLTALVAAAFALSIGANATFADQSQPTPPAVGTPAHVGHGHGHGGHLIKELGLTKDQIAQVKSIRSNFKPQFEAIKNDASLSEADKKAKFKALREQMKTQVAAVLTPEQREKLNQLRQEHREARGTAGKAHDNDAD